MLHLPRKPTYPNWALPYFANGWPLVNGRSIGTIHHITSGVAKWSRAPSCSRRLFSSSSHTLRSSSVIMETPSRDHSQHACSRTCGKRSLKISVCLDVWTAFLQGKNGEYSTSVLVSWIPLLPRMSSWLHVRWARGLSAVTKQFPNSMGFVQTLNMRPYYAVYELGIDLLSIFRP